MNSNAVYLNAADSLHKTCSNFSVCIQTTSKMFVVVVNCTVIFHNQLFGLSHTCSLCHTGGAEFMFL